MSACVRATKKKTAVPSQKHRELSQWGNYGWRCYGNRTFNTESENGSRMKRGSHARTHTNSQLATSTWKHNRKHWETGDTETRGRLYKWKENLFFFFMWSRINVWWVAGPNYRLHLEAANNWTPDAITSGRTSHTSSYIFWVQTAWEGKRREGFSGFRHHVVTRASVHNRPSLSYLPAPPPPPPPSALPCGN